MQLPNLGFFIETGIEFPEDLIKRYSLKGSCHGVLIGDVLKLNTKALLNHFSQLLHFRIFIFDIPVDH